MRGVDVEQHRPLHVDVLPLHVVGEPRDRGVDVAAEDGRRSKPAAVSTNRSVD
ncbi:hypothetical protein I546_6558 [Mycobacterium kansasii 732]|nr:hypothetical protein I546_6558 [Mycobacterium kansasii 732]